MPKTWTFHLPTFIQFGPGMIRKLGELAQEFGWNALLVGYKDQRGMEDVYQRAQRSLRSARMHAIPFFEVGPEPEAELVPRGVDVYKKNRCEMIIGLGGGSVIDVAKAIGAMVKMQGEPWDFANANEAHRRITESVPVITVPTTAGTGSEVTAISVLTFHGKGTYPDTPMKAALVGEGLHPKIAVIDPELTLGKPAHITAACAADALLQAVEACLSRMANPISSVLGGQVVRLVLGNLKAAVTNPQDVTARTKLALAACLSGAAYDVTGLTVGHAMAQALGAVFGVPHGVAVAIAGPTALRFVQQACPEALAELGWQCYISADTSQQQAGKFLDMVEQLFRDVGLPERFSVPADAPSNYLDRLVRHALEATPEACTLTPVKVDQDVLRDLFQKILTTA
ncbi:MAG: iron-containing alcohol dehydrogenase family protein [Thermogutta sp.]